MASYKIFFKRGAEKDLRGIPAPYLSRIMQKIATLSEQSRPTGVQVLRVKGRYDRLRQGDYRIIYEVDDGSKEIVIAKIGHRREVYD